MRAWMRVWMRVCFFGSCRLWIVLWGSHCGGWVGYASRRAMLQQLHGVTMYSHDEHHITSPYCWSERGKGASATNTRAAVPPASPRPSVRTYVSQSVCQSVLWPLFHLQHAWKCLLLSRGARAVQRHLYGSVCFAGSLHFGIQHRSDVT